MYRMLIYSHFNQYVIERGQNEAQEEVDEEREAAARK